MSMSQFDNIRVVLAEPNSQLRADLKEGLLGFGFKNVLVTGNLSQVVNAVDQDAVDLLIVDTSLPEGDVNTYVHELRHGHQGDNPFLVVITLVNEPSTAAVHAAINSGTDHVLAKPFTVEALIEKVTELTHARKRFVVTGDYIGPDRRSTHRPGTMEIPLLDVPNPLHHRQSGHTSKNVIRQGIDSAKVRINEQKVQRHAYQVGWLMDDVMKEVAAMKGGALEQEPENLLRLNDVSFDLCQRIRGTSYAHVAEICLTLSRMAAAALEGKLSDEDMVLMGRMAAIMESVFSPEREAIAVEYQRKSRAGRVNVFKESDTQELARSKLSSDGPADTAVA